jgi:hypothetical protein
MSSRRVRRMGEGQKEVSERKKNKRKNTKMEVKMKSKKRSVVFRSVLKRQ